MDEPPYRTYYTAHDKCRYEGCDERPKSGGLCKTHRWKATVWEGDIETRRSMFTRCYLCGEPLPGSDAGVHYDHVIPVARGGPSLPSNMRPTHQECNIRKSARTVDTSTAGIRLDPARLP